MAPTSVLDIADEARPATAADRPRDADLEALRDLLVQRPTAALSLDCFDTLLWRSVPKSTDVFYLVGERLRELGLLAPNVTPRLFMKLRVVAEQVARRKASIQRGSLEVGLAEIYDIAGWRRQTSLGAAELARQELLVDAAVTTADPRLRDLLLEIRERDVERKCFIVSDTWYDTEAMRHLLSGAGLDWLCEVPIFTSCEHGVGKWHGLLDIALRAMSVEPEHCVHVGDNVQADLRPARGLGATAVHLPRTTPLADRALVAEGWLTEPTEPSQLLEPHVGDSGLTALRGRVGRRRPATVAAEDAVAWETGAAILGPVFAGFAEWVHERTEELGIGTALCLMREGRFLAELINAVPATVRRCTGIPFWASRAACIRASFFTAKRAELARILWRPEPPSPAEILTTLGLRMEEVPGCAQVVAALAGDHRSEDVASAFIDFLVSRHDARELIVQRSAVRRKAYVQYLLGTLGDRDTSPRVALVDLGFGATIQEALTDILEVEGVDLDLRGLYLFTNHQALVRQLRGNVVEGFLADAASARVDLAALERSPQVLEVITTSADGSLLEIGTDGEPVLAPRRPDPVQDHQRAVVQDGIKAFQQAWNEFTADTTLASQRRLGQSPAVLHRILSRFIADPGIAVARAFSRWEYERNCESVLSDALVPEALERCASYLAPEHLLTAHPEHLHWVGAAAAYGGTAEQVRWLQEGRTRLGTFLAEDPCGALVLTVRSSLGHHGVQRVPLFTSDKGAGLISWKGRANADRLVLRTSGSTAVLRLDQVRLQRADGTVEYFDWRGEPRSAPFGLRIAADVPVAEGVALVSDTKAVELTVTTGSLAPIMGIEVLYRALAA